MDGLHPDVQTAFWQRVNTMFIHPDARPIVARKLVDLRRPWGAIDLLVTMLHAVGGAVEPDVDLVESALMSAATGPSDDSPRAPSLSWEVGEFLDYLERSGSNIETRARLEFLYAHLLQHTRTARALNEVLGTDPALFAEILAYVYYAEGEPHDEEVSPEHRAIALVGYTVIREWHTPPGVRPDGTMDADALRSWVTEARRLLAESGRTTIGDLVIGEVLANFPPDPDGLWPAEPVRELIEDLASPKFEEGLPSHVAHAPRMSSEAARLSRALRPSHELRHSRTAPLPRRALRAARWMAVAATQDHPFGYVQSREVAEVVSTNGHERPQTPPEGQ